MGSFCGEGITEHGLDNGVGVLWVVEEGDSPLVEETACTSVEKHGTFRQPQLKDCHTREIQEMRLERVTRLLERPCRPSWVLTIS